MYNSEIFVDKSLLIDYTNKILNTKNKSICIPRPRRFGKSTDADMLVAYYSKGCDSHELFDSLNISKAPDYLRHLNQHNVISLNRQRFLSTTNSIEGMINKITWKVTKELKMEYADYCDESVLSDVLREIMLTLLMISSSLLMNGIVFLESIEMIKWDKENI